MVVRVSEARFRGRRQVVRVLDGSTVSSGGRVVRECIGLLAKAVAAKGQVAGRVAVNECAI